MAHVRVYLALAAFAAGTAFGSGAALAASAENGKTAFVKHTSAGRVLSGTKLPFDAFQAYVRDPSGGMPPFHVEILSDSDLSDIYAYLESVPKPRPVSEIPLLRQ
jgi:mono/diheme cytochrome c family protein